VSLYSSPGIHPRPEKEVSYSGALAWHKACCYQGINEDIGFCEVLSQGFDEWAAIFQGRLRSCAVPLVAERLHHRRDWHALFDQLAGYTGDDIHFGCCSRILVVAVYVCDSHWWVFGDLLNIADCSWSDRRLSGPSSTATCWFEKLTPSHFYLLQLLWNVSGFRQQLLTGFWGAPTVSWTPYSRPVFTLKPSLKRVRLQKPLPSLLVKFGECSSLLVMEVKRG